MRWVIAKGCAVKHAGLYFARACLRTCVEAEASNSAALLIQGERSFCVYRHCYQTERTAEHQPLHVLLLCVKDAVFLNRKICLGWHCFSAPDRPDLPDSRSCLTEEWKARVDLAAAYRLCHRYGFNEAAVNHLTVMVPGTTNRFLVIAFGLMWNEVTARNLLSVDQVRTLGAELDCGRSGGGSGSSKCWPKPPHSSSRVCTCIST